MTEAPASPLLERAKRRPPPGATQPIEIVAPDRYCTDLLLEYAAPLYPAEVVSGPAWIVRVQPPAGGAWVLEFLALVERWLESAPLPCATVHCGGRSYLIRASTEVAEFAAAAESAAARATAPAR
jgi:hypothetical protein